MRRPDFLQRMSSCIMLTLLLASGLLASCSTEDTMHTEGTPLPKGKYPLELAAGGLQAVAEQGRASAPLTRGTADNNWNGISSVAVQVDGEVKEYAVTAGDDGITARLSSDNPFYWNTSNETKDIVAWYPYSATEPTQWTVKADQSRKENYEASDLIKGKLSLTFADRNNSGQNKLTFRHQTAQVKINLKAAEGVTLDSTVSVQLLNVSGVENGYTTVRPYRPDQAVHSYLALLTGQTIEQSVRFIKISVDGTDFYYTPTEAMSLAAGEVYTYAITVKANGIEVTTVTDEAWSDSGTDNIVSDIIYTADDLKPGDFIYTDGSTSDGGLRVRYADGRVKWAKPQPLPNKNKTVAAIVFWTPAETNPADRQTPANLADDKVMAAAFPDCTHGLAVSLKDVSTEKWQGSYEKVADFQKGESFNPNNKNDFKSVASGTKATDPINYVLGYQNTQVLLAYNAYCTSNSKADYIVKPVAALADFTQKCPAPANSTGWFLPSPKELHILCYKDVDNVLREYGTDTKGLVNTSLSAADGDALGNNYYMSSSESADDTDYAWGVYFDYGYLCTHAKYYAYRVRAVCAF